MINKRKCITKVIAFVLCVSIFAILIEVVCKHLYTAAHEPAVSNKDFPVVLVIGDSFCAPEFSFPHLLAERFKDRLRIVTIAENGMGPDHYLMHFSLALRHWKPVDCITAVYTGNDILELRDFSNHTVIEKVKLFLGSRLYSYHVLRRAYARLRYKALAKKNAQETKRECEYKPLMLAAAKKSPGLAMHNLLIVGKPIHDAWGVFNDIIIEMRDMARKQKVALTFVVIPESIQVSDAYQDVYRRAGFNLSRTTEDKDAIQQYMRSIFDKERVQYIDLLPILKEKDNGDLYFKDDPHLNERGHRLIADVLLEEMGKRKSRCGGSRCTSGMCGQ